MMNTKTLKPAIVLSSYTMGLGVIRALGSMGVPVIVVYYDKKDMGYVSKYVREKIVSPHPERAESDFVDLLVKLADRYKGSFLVPVSDATLSTVSRHKSLLEQYYTVACTEWGITEQFIDKKCTYALADQVGVPAPKTKVPRSTDEVEEYARSIEFPCLVKPTHSHLYYAKFKTKMVKVNNLDEMVRAYREAADADLDVMLQELIPGPASNGVDETSYFLGGAPGLRGETIPITGSGAPGRSAR
jgi:predicted ATP-grasp superfamily ATP-dependent carboligase